MRACAAGLALWLVCAPTAASAAVLVRSAARAPARRRSACTAVGEYTVRLAKPLGIVFEEAEVDKPLGVRVAQVVAGGHADLNGRVCVGDELVSTSAVVFTDKFGSGSFNNWERQMIACTRMDFGSIMAAIGSNDGRYGCVDVVLKLRPTDQTIPRPMQAARAANPADEVQWDAFNGVRSGSTSMPIRPPKDAF
ncbi:hypothetical protein KFE25_009403 [Diacronema lutheri]|uniref:PDZ domain-containing protein n=1 Tax=Diacronema lutheri TaxID=2081491 RepID=A0A8J5XY85_DIALT|nr:hypothetical protein KFE25_009403 [Diacronema lutheri]